MASYNIKPNRGEETLWLFYGLDEKHPLTRNSSYIVCKPYGVSKFKPIQAHVVKYHDLGSVARILII